MAIKRRRRPRTRPDDDELESIAKDIRGPMEFGPWVRLLIYGPNGSWKTRLAATAPTPLFAGMERTFRSIARSRARIYAVNDWDRLGRLYWALQDRRLPEFKTIVLDSVTVMHQLAMNLVLEQDESHLPERERKRPTQQHYGRANKLVEGMLIAFSDLPMHMVITAQEREIRDADLDLIETTVELPDGARKSAFGVVDIIGHMEPKTIRGKEQARMRVAKTDTQRFNKDHTGNLPRPIVKDPNMTQIIRAWRDANSSIKET